MLFLLATPLAAAQSWTTVSSGVSVAQWTNSDPNEISALKIDLCTPGVRVRATASGDRGQTTSSWASSVGAVAAVNGGFYLSGYAPDQGRAAGYGSEWSDSTDTDYRGFIGFGEHQLAHEAAGQTLSLPSWMEEAVNGDATLVYEGTAVDCGGCGSGAAPRTAAGFTQDESTLYLVAVDGRSNSSAGMTIDELAELMASLGVWRAMNLDGGGSTTLWTSTSGVMNDPSDGSERTVANHIGVLSAGSGLRYNCPNGYLASWSDLSFPGASGTTITASAGSVVTGTLSLVNTGTDAWDTHATRLAPLPRDISSAAYADDWLASHRITAVDASTAPGEVGTFSFSLTMPATEGETLTVELSVLQELVSWFGDSWGPEDGTWSITLVASAPAPEDTGVTPSDTATGEDTAAPADTSADDTAEDTATPFTPPPGKQTEMTSCGCGSPESVGGVFLALMLGLSRRRSAEARATLV